MKTQNRAATRSPVALARKAYQVAQVSLPAYFSDRSRQDFTAAQLYACLVLMEFFRTDFRGIVAYLKDFAELREALGLADKVPHYSTLCRAKERLGKSEPLNR
jgi:hypothetical protein